MNIEELRKIRNKNVAQQNELAYLEMKQCMESLTAYPWISFVLEKHELSTDTGILISLSCVPDQAGMLWYGTWLSNSKKFYDFEVLTSTDSKKIIEIEGWKEVSPDISANKKGIGKTQACIALELLLERS
jgi:hypothetical protein